MKAIYRFVVELGLVGRIMQGKLPEVKEIMARTNDISRDRAIKWLESLRDYVWEVPLRDALAEVLLRDEWDFNGYCLVGKAISGRELRVSFTQSQYDTFRDAMNSVPKITDYSLSGEERERPDMLGWLKANPNFGREVVDATLSGAGASVHFMAYLESKWGRAYVYWKPGQLEMLQQYEKALRVKRGYIGTHLFGEFKKAGIHENIWRMV